VELWVEAGLPKGVPNIVTYSRHEAEILLKHPDVKAIPFVGSLTEAKNHALILRDAALEHSQPQLVPSG
jgi:malonate-semialdehyde dehydrogenase (acetylating)/methylmalonate-semialdehyde dehydrogenase